MNGVSFITRSLCLCKCLCITPQVQQYRAEISRVNEGCGVDIACTCSPASWMDADGMPYELEFFKTRVSKLCYSVALDINRQARLVSCLHVHHICAHLSCNTNLLITCAPLLGGSERLFLCMRCCRQRTCSCWRRWARDSNRWWMGVAQPSFPNSVLL